MYLDYWHLQRSPFDAVPDSRSYFPAPRHEQALAAMTYAACASGEPVLLTGDTGCGKTLLFRTLRRQLPRERYQVVFVPELSSTGVDLLRRVAYHLTQTVPADGAVAMDVILQAVNEAEEQNRFVVIMMDDWPASPSREDLDGLRWLLNADVESARVCMLLAAEAPASELVWPPWLQQRLLASATLGPLAADQVPDYLQHRLCSAGHPKGDVFTAEAMTAITEWSGGVPRLVNRLAHLSLQVASLSLAAQVDASAIQCAAERLACGNPAPIPAGASA
ncbi:MAG: AAA family ATPase [Phycisphaerae bacterium]